MFVYVIRSSDSWAHEGHDAVESIFMYKPDADICAEKWNAADGKNRYSFYVEEWEVE